MDSHKAVRESRPMVSYRIKSVAIGSVCYCSKFGSLRV